MKPSITIIGAGSTVFARQLMTDIMAMPLYTVNTTEGAAFGAAILASVGAGAWTDVPSACAQLIRALGPHRDVDVEAKRALLHLGV